MENDGSGVGQGLEVAASGDDCTQTADEFHAHTLLHLFGLAQQYGANLPGAADVGASAGVQVEVADVDEAQLFADGGRNLADSHGARFVGSGEANLDGTVFGDDFVRQPLGGFNLLWVDLLGREIDGAVVVAHVKRHGREAVELFEGCREDVLAGVLLHVIATAVGIDFATNRYPRLQPTGRALDTMHDVAGLLLLLNFDDPYAGAVGDPKDLAGVEVLAAAGGIES